MGCALHRAQDPHGAGIGWNTQEELLAVLLELLDRHDRHFVIAHSKQNARKPKPLRVPRPRDQAARRERRPATGAEIANLAAGLGGAKVAVNNGD